MSNPKLPVRAPYVAHDRELDKANELGIRPPTDAENDPARRDPGPRSRILKRKKGR